MRNSWFQNNRFYQNLHKYVKPKVGYVSPPLDYAPYGFRSSAGIVLDFVLPCNAKSGRLV